MSKLVQYSISRNEINLQDGYTSLGFVEDHHTFYELSDKVAEFKTN